MKEKIKYNIGLDLGTDSVGWAVVDENNEIISKNDKLLWGSRLFPEANAKKDTRLFRSSRRKYDRRRDRIEWLDLFTKQDMDKIDTEFFKKMQNSFRVKTDREDLPWCCQFFNSRMEYRKMIGNYKTIYHLRKQCMQDEKVDFRLVYLCLHHILKYRGNFLYEGQTFDVKNMSISESVSELLNEISQDLEINLDCSDENVKKVCDIIDAKRKEIKSEETDGGKKYVRYSFSDKKKDFSAIFKVDKASQKALEEIFILCFGRKTSLKNIFDEDLLQKIQVSFATDYEEKESEIASVIQDKMMIFEIAKRIYSYIVLKDVLGEKEFISDAMIENYEAHQKDLKAIKDLYRNRNYFSKDEFKQMFKKHKIEKKAKKSDTEEKTNSEEKTAENKEKASYTLYISDPKKCDKDDLYSEIKKQLTGKMSLFSEEDAIVAKNILERIEDGEFLPKQTTTKNGEIPMQLHENELKMILSKQGQYYPSLKEHSAEIIKVFEFRIPYFIGPLNSESKFGWIVKSSNKRVTPFNFDDENFINKEETAEKFIVRMLNKCTYLPNEFCMPKQSITCQFYEVLQELNGIRINGSLLPKDIKQKIVCDVFMKKNTVYVKDIVKYLETIEGYSGKELNLKGTSDVEKFASSLSSYVFFSNALHLSGEEIRDNLAILDNIVKDLTIFKDGEIRALRLHKNFGKFINSQDAERVICKHKFDGWSSVSKKLVNGLVDDKIHQKTILDYLWTTNKKLMNLISDDDYGFKAQTESEQENYYKNNGFGLKEQIDKLYCAPNVKRTIWQTILVVKEITKIMGTEPDRVFMEFDGEEGEKKQKESRDKKLIKLYENFIKETKDQDAIVNLKSLRNVGKEINNEMTYLYYLQNGKCMYTGKPLTISMLSQTCEVDHIIPQSILPDDSFDNKALVLKNQNQCKTDRVLNPEIQSRQRCTWESLNKYGLISAKKLNFLMADCHDEKVLKGFLNKQIVATRQAIKEATKILRVLYPDFKVENENYRRVISVNASLSSNYRAMNRLFKNRLVNDCHHAHDAYLACVLGAYLYRKFPCLNDDVFYKAKTDAMKDTLLANINIKGNYGLIISKLGEDVINAKGETIWNKSTNQLVEDNIYNKKSFVTRKTDSSENGKLYNATIYKKGYSNKIVGVNNNRNNTDLYGGYSSLEIAYFAVVKSIIKGKKAEKVNYSIENINKLDIINAKKEKISVIDYIEKKLSDERTKAEVNKCFGKNQMLEVNGFPILKVGNKDIQNAKTLRLEKEDYYVLATIKDNLINYKLFKELYFNELSENFDDYIENQNFCVEKLLNYKLNLFYKKFFNMVKICYRDLPAFNAQSMLDFENNYCELDLLDKIYFTNNLFCAFRNGSTNLSKLGGSSEYGRLKKTLDINKDKIKLVNRSITGYYQNKTKVGK